MLKRALVVAGLVIVAGCGNLDTLTNLDGGNCNLSDRNVCLEFPDSATDGAAKTAACTALQTSFSASGQSYTAGTGNDCPTTNRLGSCAVSQGSLKYYSGDWDAGTAETDCTGIQHGTWTAG